MPSWEKGGNLMWRGCSGVLASQSQMTDHRLSFGNQDLKTWIVEWSRYKCIKPISSQGSGDGITPEMYHPENDLNLRNQRSNQWFNHTPQCHVRPACQEGRKTHTAWRSPAHGFGLDPVKTPGFPINFNEGSPLQKKLRGSQLLEKRSLTSRWVGQSHKLAFRLRLNPQWSVK